MANAAELAKSLSTADQRLLEQFPLSEGRSWLCPVRFYQAGIATTLRWFILFGPLVTVLTPKGRAVRRILRRARP